MDLGEPEDEDLETEEELTAPIRTIGGGLYRHDVLMETEFGVNPVSGKGQRGTASQRSSWLYLSEDEQNSKKCSNVVKRFCGLTTEGEEREARLEKKRIRELGYDVTESFHWARFTDANAIVIVGVTFVICALFL